MNEALYSHPTLPLTARAHAWKAAGYAIYDNSQEVGVSSSPMGMHELLAQGLLEHPENGEAAIRWAVNEHQRRQEESSRNRAQFCEARAIEKLAAALNASVESEVLQRILGRLTEKTQYAVRQQLGC